MQLVAIALGGAAGAVLRFLSMIALGKLAGIAFPWGTLTVNVVGSFAMGLLVVVFDNAVALPANLKLFLTIGFLGGFTTFSTFSMDTMRLIETGEIGAAFAYTLGSVILSVGGCCLGLWIARSLLS